MAVRPGQIRYLTEGKAVGAKAHKGFVATWNWVLSWIYNFSVGPGLKLTGERAGKPRLSLTLLNEDGAPIDDGGEDTPYETGGGDGGATIPGAFEPVYTDGVLSGFTNCIYCAERQFVSCGEADSEGIMAISGVTASTSGYVVLSLPHDTTASGDVVDDAFVSVAVEGTLPTNTNDSVTKIPLYHITDGVVDVDLRAVPTAVLAR